MEVFRLPIPAEAPTDFLDEPGSSAQVIRQVIYSGDFNLYSTCCGLTGIIAQPQDGQGGGLLMHTDGGSPPAVLDVSLFSPNDLQEYLSLCEEKDRLTGQMTTDQAATIDLSRIQDLPPRVETVASLSQPFDDAREARLALGKEVMDWRHRAMDASGNYIYPEDFFAQCGIVPETNPPPSQDHSDNIIQFPLNR